MAEGGEERSFVISSVITLVATKRQVHHLIRPTQVSWHEGPAVPQEEIAVMGLPHFPRVEPASP